MSNSFRSIIMVGIVLGDMDHFDKTVVTEDKFWEKFCPEDDDIDYYGIKDYFKAFDLDFVVDHMNGDYVLLGEIIQETADSDYDQPFFDRIAVFDSEYLEELSRKVEDKIDNSGLEFQQDVKLFVFSYWH